MALASWRVQIIKRSEGKSAVAAAAYRSAQTLYDEYTGLTHSYVHKQDVISTDILAPANAPFWVYDPDQLWNRAGGAERQFNGQVAREVRIALPRELTQEQNIDLARSFAQYFANQGMVAHVFVHDKEDGNPHSHIMLTMRPLDGDNFSKRKNRDWNKTEIFLEWRKEYERLTNEYLERYGHKERIDVRSYVEQEIDRIPTIHLGVAAHRMEQRGIHTDRGDINRRIAEQNKEIEEINRQITESQKEVEQLAREIAEEERRRKEELVKKVVVAQKSAEPEPISTHHDRFLERYVRVAQSIHRTEEVLQDLLTEKGIKDFAAQEKNVEDVREPLTQPIQEPETPSYHVGVEESERKQQLDYDTVTKKQEKESPPYHSRIEEPDRKRQLQQEYDALYEAAKQKRKEHRLVRDPERQNRRYQSAYEQAEERDRKISWIEQTTDHRRPEPPKPERQPDFQEQYRIAERRHHELERQKRRYSRSRDDPEHEK